MILVVSNADTDLLALRSVVEALPAGMPPVRAAHPAKLGGPPHPDGLRAVVVRLLGGRRAWESGFDDLRAACARRGVALVGVGGEAAPDTELAGLSLAAPEIVAAVHEYFVAGGLANTTCLLRFLADTFCGTSLGYEPPVAVAASAVWRPRRGHDRPVVGVVFYRAHVLSGNTTFVDDLCAALESRGADPHAVWCYSLRPDADGRVPAVELLAEAGVDAVITTVLAAGGAGPGSDWDPGPLGELGVPVVQAICASSPADAWRASSGGLSPLDATMNVAIPEFDGRVISVPLSTKEVVDDGDVLGTPVTAYRSVPDRVARVAGLATRLAGLRQRPPADRRIAIVLSAYPTRRARIGNAVGLDTPASVVALLHHLSDVGHAVSRLPPDGDALMAELIETFSYERATLSAAQLAAAPARLAAGEYARWFATLPPTVRAGVEERWGPPPGTVYVDLATDELVFPGLDLGGVFVGVQPPRGFGEDPIALYHSPELPPTHHYLGFYRWLDAGFGAHAIVHAGKHGTLEWLPGKSVGLSAECFPDAALGDVPLVYPFIVNDPGEGTQAKRRAHAVIIDHLVPPLTRAETYDELARLEALLDEHARVAALDPAKLPLIRQQVWDTLVAAELHRDLGWSLRPDEEEFDAALLAVDGYLCELKDAQIRGGLHILGQPPAGEALVDLVLAVCRLSPGGGLSLRASVAARLGIDLATASRSGVDAVEAECRRLVEQLAAAGWVPAAVAGDPVLGWVAERLVPALARTTDELTNLAAALDGRHVPPGPSGAPTRGMAHVLPTGRNFYSVDPKAVPSRLAWEVGWALAQAACERHLAERGRWPETVGLVIWGTSAMRTSGDDVAEALALLGVRPVWAEESPRVAGIEPIGLAELGRPRIDVTLRISGFFRDAFPHLVALLDEAVALVGALCEAPEDNYVRAHGATDPRVFGPKPGAYGSGIFALLEAGNWEGDADLSAVYTAWSGWAYTRAAMGVAAPEAMRRRFAAIDVAAKNQDNREHDIFDSDDYLQDHGGMIATARFLRGALGESGPLALFGDSADPARPRVRSLAEEAARVVRSRVLNPRWIQGMRRHGYKGAFEMAATVDYMFGYDATAGVVEDWMYERVTAAYVADPEVRKFFAASNPWVLANIAERLLEAHARGLWDASEQALAVLRDAVLEAEGWEESRGETR